MKRILSLFLILILSFPIFLPVSSFASTEDELIGTWVGSSEFYYGEVNYFLVRLYDDHTALYESNKIHINDSEGFCTVCDATWELMEDGVHVYFTNIWDSGKKEDFHLELTQSHYLAYKLVNSYIIFAKLPERRKPGTFHTVSSWDK